MFEKLLSRIAKELDKNNIPYMIIGGQAVLLYGEPRLTRDIDVTLGSVVGNWQHVLKVMDKIKIKPLPKEPAEFVKHTWVLPGEEKKSGIRVDFIFSFTPYEQQAIKRGRKIKLGGGKVNFASPEDLVIHKLFAGRPRDIEDVKGIIAKNPKLDKKYIKKWLEEFETSGPAKGLIATFTDCLKAKSGG